MELTREPLLVCPWLCRTAAPLPSQSRRGRCQARMFSTDPEACVSGLDTRDIHLSVSIVQHRGDRENSNVPSVSLWLPAWCYCSCSTRCHIPYFTPAPGLSLFQIGLLGPPSWKPPTFRLLWVLLSAFPSFLFPARRLQPCPLNNRRHEGWVSSVWSNSVPIAQHSVTPMVGSSVL